MKLNIFILISFSIIVSCTSKQEKIDDAQYHCSENTIFVEDSSLLRIKFIHSNGFLPKEGYIATPELATKLAFNILSEIYGDKEIKAQLPFTINLDKDVWVIEGFIEKGVDGGSAYIEIDKQTGEILKLLHSK